MIKAHQIKLIPTKAQETLLHKSFGCARHSYNWALNKWQQLYKEGERPSAYSLIKLQNSIKKTEMPFYSEVTKCAVQYAIHHLETAYKKMWKEKKGYPKFKKKGATDSYVAVENEASFKQKNKKIWLPRIGWVKCTENLRFEGKVNYVAVKRIADMYFAIINIEVPESIPTLKQPLGENQTTVGVDLGIKTLMVLSDGTVYENPKALRSSLKQLKRLQRSLCRKQKGSNNRKKQQMKVARKNYRISCIRKNAIHQATSDIVKKYDNIVIEDLGVSGLLKNNRLSQAIGDASFGEIARQLIYKARWQGKEVVKADRFFASSKTCSNCGCKKQELKLSERTYNCETCGFSIDRDLNAARNLANYSPTPKCGESEACGETLEPRKAQRCSKKQEVNKLSNKIVQNSTLS